MVCFLPFTSTLSAFVCTVIRFEMCGRAGFCQTTDSISVCFMPYCLCKSYGLLLSNVLSWTESVNKIYNHLNIIFYVPQKKFIRNRNEADTEP